MVDDSFLVASPPASYKSRSSSGSFRSSLRTTPCLTTIANAPARIMGLNPVSTGRRTKTAMVPMIMARAAKATMVPVMTVPTAVAPNPLVARTNYGSGTTDSYGSSKPPGDYGSRDDNSYGSSTKPGASNNYGNNDSYSSSKPPPGNNDSYGSSSGPGSGPGQQDYVTKSVNYAAQKAGYNVDDATANKIGAGIREGLSKFGGGHF
ncbi:hypothetical protein BC827DRAFT_452197 [Russula dissimulans]|nr:hypothetical protein BC827DRAFT_452197 [Russula dissimulans]